MDGKQTKQERIESVGEYILVILAGMIGAMTLGWFVLHMFGAIGQ